jgi:hypothetical protein
MTDDETCGWDTPSGPCQNPPTEGERCWIPSHGDPDAENPHGRDFALGPEDHDDILESARAGMSKSGCARAAGVSKSQLDRYVDAHPDFRSEFARARAKGEQRLVSGPLMRDPDAPREMDGQHARFLLATSFGYEKTEKREVDMDADVEGEVSVNINREVVGDDE